MEAECEDCWATNYGDGPVVLCPLHAAAHELLTALKLIITTHQNALYSPEPDCTKCKEVIEQAKSAIAKAEART